MRYLVKLQAKPAPSHKNSCRCTKLSYGWLCSEIVQVRVTSIFFVIHIPLHQCLLSPVAVLGRGQQGASAPVTSSLAPTVAPEYYTVSKIVICGTIAHGSTF